MLFCGFLSILRILCPAPLRECFKIIRAFNQNMAAIAQLGERQTEDLEVPSSILGHGICHWHPDSSHVHCECHPKDTVNAPEPGIVSRRQNFRSASNNLLDLVCIVLVTRVWPCVNMLYFKMPPACLHDNVSEWLRRWTRNPLGSAREGSNPFVVALLHDHAVAMLHQVSKVCKHL